MTPDPFLRGCAWNGTSAVPYPRADPKDFSRLPIDTWGTAQLPATVRLELVADGGTVDIAYRTATDDLGYRGAGAGSTFAAWRGDEQLDEQPAVVGDGVVTLAVTAGPVTIYLPEGMKPTVVSVEGNITPAPAGPRWVAYGDSLAEGWVASGPARAWPAVAARRFGLDVVNLGYAGSARGEIVSAEHIAAIPADVISITHGTNCWTRIPHSRDQMAANTAAFLDVVRQGHPDTPIVLASPVLRPDAEATPNRLGATLADLREAMEEVGRRRSDVTLVSGDGLLTAAHLPDGIHPGDEGHEILARVFGGAVASAVGMKH